MVGALYGAATLVVMVVLAGFLGSVSSDGGRLLLFLGIVVATSVTCGFGIFQTIAQVGDAARTARFVGERVPELSQTLLTAVELEEDLKHSPDFSVSLAHAFLADTMGRAQALEESTVLDREPVKRASAILTVALGVAALAVLPFRETFWNGLAAPFARKERTAAVHREPITGDVELTYRYPAYTGLQPRSVPGTSGDISAPKGTEVEIKTRADRDVEKAELVFGEKHLPLQVTPPRDLTGRFVVEASGSYHFAFLSGSTEVAKGPEYPVNLEADEPPKVTLLTPGEELEVDPNEKVVLKFEATDDYGLTEAQLVYRLPRDKEEQRVAVPRDDGRKTRGTYAWDLGALKLGPGDRVSYYIEAKDNDTVDGPKKGASRTHELKVYSAAEHRREAVARAAQLWERTVLFLGDRMEGPDRKNPTQPDVVASRIVVDQSGLQLAADFAAAAQELVDGKDSPQELWKALANIGEGLHKRIRATSDFRRLYLRYAKSSTSEIGLSTRFSRLLEEEIGELEKDILYLETLIDRQKLFDLQEMAKELGKERRELASRIEDYKQTKDPKAQEQILGEIRALRERIEALMERMSELAKGIRDEHLNAEALQDLMEEKDLSSALDEVEKLMREGKADEALAKLQELGMQMEEMLKNLDTAEQEFGGQEYSELAEKFKGFMEDVNKTAQEQKGVSDRTRDIRDRYKSQLKERLKQLSQGLKDPLLKAVEEVSRDYRDIGPDPLNSRADAPLEEVQSELENLKNALKVDDFDLAAESAERADRAAQELSMYGDQQRQLDQAFQNPPAARAESSKLAERLGKDARKVQDINQKLQKLFPAPGSMMSEEDRSQLKNLSKEQKQVEKRAQGLQQKMDELSQMAPIFDGDAEEQLEQVAQRMGAASERLEGSDPNRSYGEQKAAQDLLQQFQQQMQQNQSKGKGGKGLPLPMFAGGRRSGWGQTQSREKVEIPDADQHQAPKEFRQDLLDAMKQGAPEKYKDQVKRYYEELVK
jgi:hypothetical protein